MRNENEIMDPYKVRNHLEQMNTTYVSMIFCLTAASSWTGAVRSCASSWVWLSRWSEQAGIMMLIMSCLVLNWCKVESGTGVKWGWVLDYIGPKAWYRPGCVTRGSIIWQLYLAGSQLLAKLSSCYDQLCRFLQITTGLLTAWLWWWLDDENLRLQW